MKRAEGIEYETKRVPAYTDRILWKSMPALTTATQAHPHLLCPHRTSFIPVCISFYS